MSDNVNHELRQRLAAPFAADEIQWKPAAVSGNRALAICYVSVRAVMDRLDDVFGVGGWQTSYRETSDGVNCRLEVWIGDRWIQHEDFGAFSEQPDGGDKVKAAYSDSLKRVAVHLGVGRYLHAVPCRWLPWDSKARKFLQPPQLPAEAAGPVKAGSRSSPAGQTPLNGNQAAANGISAKQWAALEALCKAKGCKAANVLAHFHVTKPREIPADRFAEAAALIEKTRA
jgi:hypothetical protein